MATPREILNLAANKPAADRRPERMCEPPEPTQEQPVSGRALVPQPIRETSVYRQLMRSHDRMRTRHIRDNPTSHSIGMSRRRDER